MKASDYIVNYLIGQGVTDIFGYPGGMVTHLMDSLSRKSEFIRTHVTASEQGAALCACGYAEICKKPGVAYATSGPGATNLITGIANAFFDSIPCVFITGQVNTYESKGLLPIRQRGFQETDIVSMVQSITKYAIQINSKDKLEEELDKAFQTATEGRPGPVLLDIPMDIFRAEISPKKNKSVTVAHRMEVKVPDCCIEQILKMLGNSKKPVIVAGHGIVLDDSVQEFRNFVNIYSIPVVTSMNARDVIPADSKNNFGFLGAYGHRVANIIVNESDLIISLGSRLDCRQVGNDLKIFAKKAKLIRVDIDTNEFARKIKPDEIDVAYSVKKVLVELISKGDKNKRSYSRWYHICDEIRKTLINRDKLIPNIFIEELSNHVSDDTVITTDVGQNQVWIAQSFSVKNNQRLLFSGGHGTMGYSLPAAIGACMVADKPVICFNGDGGLQMNMQELQLVDRERLPIKIIVLNNNSLGMIRHFQEMYFESEYTQTVSGKGYSAPDMKKLANLYNLSYIKLSSLGDLDSIKDILKNSEPCLIEVVLSENTYVYPKLAMGRSTSDQDPLLDRELYHRLMRFCDEC